MMADLLANLSVRELAARLRDKSVSAAELARHFAERARAQADLNALLRFVEDGDDAAGGAGAAEAEWGAAADAVAHLRGIPMAHKDIFCAKGQLTTCASKILHNFVVPYDSAVVERCCAAGLTTIARANMDEFAMGSSGEHSAFGATLNPWDKTRVPGGSSSGSAAAVAARLAPIATATDTGGSIRQPAAFCGITGIRPTYGRVSRWGMVAFASSFDQGGVLAKSADDCALALSAMAGFDQRDSTSLQAPPEDFTRDIAVVSAAGDKPLAGRVIGLPREFFAEGLDNAVAARVQAAARALEELGATLKEVSLPSLPYAISAYYVLTCAEASSNLSRYDGVRYGHRAQAADLTAMYEKTRGEGFGREVKRRILTGAYMLSYGYYDAYYRRAMKVRKLIADDFAAAFAADGGGCDALLGPTTPGTAFALGAIGTDDPVAMYLQDIYTVPVNLAGLPALSVPCGFADGLPVGLHLIGAAKSEARLLGMAHAYQMQTDFHLQTPPGVA